MHPVLSASLRLSLIFQISLGYAVALPKASELEQFISKLKEMHSIQDQKSKPEAKESVKDDATKDSKEKVADPKAAEAKPEEKKEEKPSEAKANPDAKEKDPNAPKDPKEEAAEQELKAFLDLLPKPIRTMIENLKVGLKASEVLKILPQKWKEAIKSKDDLKGEGLRPNKALVEELLKNYYSHIQGRPTPLDRSASSHQFRDASRDKLSNPNMDYRSGQSGKNCDRSGNTAPRQSQRANISEKEERALQATKNLMMPANVGGNPSFGIMNPAGDGKMGNCQGTLFKTGETQSPEICTMATAAHCVFNDQGNWSPQFSTAYGIVKDAFVHQKREQGSVSTDIVAVEFSGEVCRNMKKSGVPVLKLRQNDKIENGDTAFLGTRYFERLHHAIVENVLGKQATIRLEGNGVHTGDSGGGLVTINEHGEMELAGVLSAANAIAGEHVGRDGKSLTQGSLNAFYSIDGSFLREKGSEIENRHRLSTPQSVAHNSNAKSPEAPTHSK